MSKLVAEEYLSSLTDLTVNSKPLINMLTMLADENVDHAPAIVQVIESHLEKVPPDVKLPILYLIDSIIKNVSKVYVPLFTQNIVNVFVSVFEKVDERTRLNMYKLRQTWADVFPAKKLYVLDLRVKDIDHAWPVTAPTPTSIHFNPKFLGNKSTAAEVTSGTNSSPQMSTPATTPVTTQSSELSEAILREQLPKKQKILIELQQKKLKLQLMQTKAIIEGQENQLNETGGQANAVPPPVNEETGKLFSRRGAVKSKAVVAPPSNTASSKLSSNLGQSKTKIAPASTQLIEAAKSRDPRIAKQQQQNKSSSSQNKTKASPAKSQSSETSKSRESKSSKKQKQNKVSEVAHKEQEIYNRQLAMLKTPIAEQVAPVVPAQKVLENLVNVSGKDVDLRLLTVRSGSPTKKRLSTETPVVEEPPKKKNKSKIFDELFGSEDVDLRKMTRGNLPVGDRIPSPPPPPVISNGPTAPQIAAIAPLVVGDNNKQTVADDASNSPRDDQLTENKSKERENFEWNRGRYRKSWAEIKVKPEAEIKPMPLPPQLGLEIDQRKDASHSSFESPEKGGKKHFRDRNSARGELDRLGRPLLYNKLPNDPRARRESLGGLYGRDTDMRRLGSLMDRDIDTNINVNMIMAQAADQVRNGTMSLHEYNELLKQVIHVNEKQKLRETQSKSRQEIRRSHRRNRRSPNRFGSQSRNSPTYRHDDDRRDRRPYNDIDERLQMPWGNIPHNDSSGFNRLPELCGPNRKPFYVPEYDDRPAKPDIWEDDKSRFRRIDDFNHLEKRHPIVPDGVDPSRPQIGVMENLAPPVTNVLETPMIVDTNSSSGPNVPQNNPSDDINSMAPNFDVAQQPTARPMGGGPLDILSSLMSGVSAPEQSTGLNYQVENKDSQQVTQPSAGRPETDAINSQSPWMPAPVLGSGLNINDLFQRLVASGIVPTLANTASTNQKPQKEPQVKPIDFSDSNSLRERQPAIINLLYSGIQCSSCGVRFSPEETVKYSRHLDWHFRQNRREKDAARKGQSRKWYYDVSDWIQFEEIEDLEERAQSWFETEGTGNGDENNEQEEIKSVPAPPGHDFTLCELCRDEFDTYYNEEKEEWHLKPCIKVEEKYYHPFCYEDLVNAPEESFIPEKTADTSAGKEENAVESMQISEEPKEEVGEEAKAESDPDVSISAGNESEEYLELKMDTVEKAEESEENADEVVKALLNELINCIVFKHEMELEEKREEEEEQKEEDEEAEIEVLESVPAEQKKEIINVDLIEKLDDEDDVVFQRKTPSPIVLIPTAKIKQEPVDEMESPVAVVDQTYTSVVSSIDGNVEMTAPQIAPSGSSRIKITFNKPITSDQQSEKQVIKVPELSTPEEADPEPLPLKPKKPRIAEREMTVYLPCVRGTEESGLCSIM